MYEYWESICRMKHVQWDIGQTISNSLNYRSFELAQQDIEVSKRFPSSLISIFIENFNRLPGTSSISGQSSTQPKECERNPFLGENIITRIYNDIHYDSTIKSIKLRRVRNYFNDSKILVKMCKRIK